MANEEQQSGELLTQSYDPVAAISTRPGYTTSQFGLTAVFTLVCMVLGYFGISQTPEQLDSYLALAERVATTLVPILGGIWAVVNYTNSRGKIASNTVNANSAVQVAALAGLPGVSAILGGKNWKDPQRYLNIADLVGGFVPSVGKITSKIRREEPIEGQQASFDGGLSKEDIDTLKAFAQALREKQ